MEELRKGGSKNLEDVRNGGIKKRKGEVLEK